MAGEFCRRAQAAHTDLVVTSGSSSTHTGLGDPYLPFREAMGQRTGDNEFRWAARTISRDHVLRLWTLLPWAVQGLVVRVRTFSTLWSRAGLSSHGRRSSPRQERSGWDTLRRLVERKTSIPQAGLYAEYARVVQALARRQPLLDTLDDLQWADAGSSGLLFLLGRQIENNRILILGLYRPTEVAEGRGGELHLLEPIVNELKEVFGDV